jgi:mitochondrial fission protein ELM1
MKRGAGHDDIRSGQFVVAVHDDQVEMAWVDARVLHLNHRPATAAQQWRSHFANLKRPLVAVLLGGNNGRFRLDTAVAREIAGQIVAMMRHDGVGVAVTPSRRTDTAVTQVFARALEPHGGYVWDGSGDNPYFGMLALADAVIVTVDSVSMVSEAVATSAPVMVARLPGRSRRNGVFMQALLGEGRIREFSGRFEQWPVAPLDDTPLAAAEMCRRLGLPQPEAPC